MCSRQIPKLKLDLSKAVVLVHPVQPVPFATILGAQPRRLGYLQDVLVFRRYGERAFCNLARYL